MGRLALVVLAGAVVLGLGIHGAERAMDDPQIDLRGDLDKFEEQLEWLAPPQEEEEGTSPL